MFSEEKVAYAEANLKEVKEVVQKFMTEGVAGLWDWIKDQAEMLMTTVVDGIKDWLLTRMVIGFAEWIAGLLIPGGAIVKLIQGIYKLVMFFVDNIQRIIRWVGAVLDSLGSIAAGAIPSAITFIVDAMKTIIPVILDFFAKLLNISGLVNAVQDIIAKVTAPIHKAIDKFVAWISKLMEKVLKRFKGGKDKTEKEGEKDNEAKKKQEEKEKQPEMEKSVYSRAFSMYGESHHIYIRTDANKLEATMASKNEERIKKKFNRAIETIKSYHDALREYPELKNDFEKEIKPIAVQELESQISLWTNKMEGLNSKNRENILANPEIKKQVDAIVNFLVDWGNSHRIKDMTPEAILECIEEGKIAVWKKEVRRMRSDIN